MDWLKRVPVNAFACGFIVAVAVDAATSGRWSAMVLCSLLAVGNAVFAYLRERRRDEAISSR